MPLKLVFLRHCEALAEAIHNPAHIKSYHLVIARALPEAIYNPAYIKLYKTLQFQTFKILL
ncbi:hypothetical protein [Helicobacter rodentium]|uniref:hypothetical protein n=1 Tax=Helicobacter rodentium TaxID=59617 RepID=UPI000AF819F5|nr:hypothetical protein [Helicobacter rodentium]